MPKSEAAKTVKFGFWLALGFFTFYIVAAIILLFALRALSSD